MTRFTRCISLMSVLAAFYIGHGLHSQTPLPLPGLASEAHADGVSAIQAQYNKTVTIYTTNKDGRTLFVWQHIGGTGKHPEFIGSFDAVAKK